jgi:hypothetical protein
MESHRNPIIIPKKYHRNPIKKIIEISQKSQNNSIK